MYIYVEATREMATILLIQDPTARLPPSGQPKNSHQHTYTVRLKRPQNFDHLGILALKNDDDDTRAVLNYHQIAHTIIILLCCVNCFIVFGCLCV